MEKIILFLDGVPAGKTQFIETVKSKNYWVWNLNFRNLLSMVAHKLFWDGNRNENYYNFLAELESLSSKHFNSKEIYLNFMIDKFLKNEKVQILIIHNSDLDAFKATLQKYSNTFNIFITDQLIEIAAYYKTYNYKDENYIQQILDFIKLVTGENDDK